MNLMNYGDYKEAYEILKELDYKDSADKLVEAKYKYHKVLLAQLQVGDYVHFGSYEQDNDTTNGKEDIEWLVLAKRK